MATCGILVLFRKGKIMELALMIFFAVINLVLFAIAAADKRAAIQRRRRRVSERALWLGAAFGGAMGLYLAMRLFRHKTKHKSFMIGVPVLIAIHCAALFLILK